MEELRPHFASILGVRLAYSEIGDGPALICLHSGMPASSGRFDFAANLEALSRRSRVILVDLPSFGMSGMPMAGTSDDEAGFAADVVSGLIDHLGAGRVSVVGNGLGGEVALHLAAASPEIVDRLVLIAPTGCRYSPFTPVPMEGMKAVATYWRQPSPQRMAAVLRLLYPEAPPDLETDAARRHSEAAEASSTLREWHRASVRPEVLSLGPAIAAPTLLIWGREDRFSPLDHGLSLLTRIPEARFHLLPRCGHNAQRDQAGEVNTLLADFLRGEE